MSKTPPEVLEKWRKEFESGKSPQAIQRDAKNPDCYWNDPIQYQWEGFLHRCKTADENKLNVLLGLRWPVRSLKLYTATVIGGPAGAGT